MQKEMKYSTQDFPLIVSLVASGFVIKTIEFDESNLRGTCYFDQSAPLLNIVEQFWAEKLEIEDQRFFQAYKLVKNRLNEAKRGYEAQ